MSLDGADPDGIELESIWLLHRDDRGDDENQAPVERLDLEAEVARWSEVRMAPELPADAITHQP